MCWCKSTSSYRWQLPMGSNANKQAPCLTTVASGIAGTNDSCQPFSRETTLASETVLDT